MKIVIKSVEIVKPDNFESYSRWLSRNMTEGRELAKYSCPHCNATLFTNIPCTGDVADSFCNCPVCDATYLKITDNQSGTPVVNILLISVIE